MRIAAVITAYNSADTIERALESVLQQTRRADEVIVVDDGSRDNTGDLVRRFKGVRLVERLNGGPAAARNSGLSAVTADWVAFLDGDDRWMPEKLARIEESIVEHPEVSVFFSSVMAVEGSNVSEKIGAPEWVLGVDELLQGCPILTPSSAVVKTSAVRTVGGFNEKQRDGEDWEFWLRLASEGPFRRVPGPLAVYYIHETGHHNRYVATRKQATRFVTRAALRHLRKEGPVVLPIIREALAEHFRAFTYYASLERNLALTLTTGLAAVIVDPFKNSYAATRSLFRAVTGA